MDGSVEESLPVFHVLGEREQVSLGRPDTSSRSNQNPGVLFYPVYSRSVIIM